MGIQLEQLIDLRSDAVFSFIQDPKRTTYDEPVPQPAVDFRVDSAAERVLATDTRSRRFCWAVRETYTILRNDGTAISNVDVIVPHWQELAVTIISVLYLRGDTPPDVAEAVRESLRSYDPNSEIDPNDWARSRMPPDAQSGFAFFDVRLRAQLRKLGTDSDRSGRDLMLRELQKSDDVIVRGPEKHIMREVVPMDSHKEEVTSRFKVKDPQLVENVAKKKATKMTPECENLEVVAVHIADVLQYPEFKIEWEFVEVTIGCVRVTLHLPVGYKRTTTQQAWGTGTQPTDAPDYLKNVVRKCTTIAAASSVVVVLVTANGVAAVEAFKAVFIECVKNSLLTMVKCVVPDLIWPVHHSEWSNL